MKPNLRSELRAVVVRGGILFFAGLVGIGCSDGSSELGAVTTPDAAVASAAFDLSLDDLPAELDLTDAQREALGAALAELQAARGVQRGPRGGDPGDRPGRGREGRGGRGPDGPPRSEDPGDPGIGAGPGPGPFGPLHPFVVRAAEILDRDQFVILARHLAETRPQPGERGRHGGRGQRDDDHGRRMGGRLAALLGLTEAQAEAVHDVMDAHRTGFRALLDQVRDEEITVEAALVDALGLVRTTKSDLAAILTAEQLARLEELRAERIGAGLDRRIDRLDERMTARAHFISAALDLDDAASAEVEEILLGTVSAREALLEEVRSGELDPQIVVLRTIQIERQAAAAIEALLGPEQQAAWEALRDHFPRPRFGF